MFGGVDNSSELAQIETFGPLVSVIRFTDDNRAVSIANDSPPRPECLRAHPRSGARSHGVARRLESGSVWINQTAVRSLKALRRLQTERLRPYRRA